MSGGSLLELASLRFIVRGRDGVLVQSASLAEDLLAVAGPLEAHDVHRIDIRSSEIALVEVFGRVVRLPNPRTTVYLNGALFLELVLMSLRRGILLLRAGAEEGKGGMKAVLKRLSSGSTITYLNEQSIWGRVGRARRQSHTWCN